MIDNSAFQATLLARRAAASDRRRLIAAHSSKVDETMLPPRLRAAYGLSFTSRQRRFVRRWQVVSRAVVPRLPQWVRTFPILHPLQGAWNRVGPLAVEL